ncbi:hypothetical protein TWF730_001108 [Orbilia blumenaviensis]|uniref:Uncharacterized protein n=1 Tax=Orbilia blumenaviensis TaxID=1796055 RepID=A0AAV9VNS3_9PEZI
MSQTLSDDEDMMSSPSSPATPINTTSNPHLPSHLDLKTPPQSQDNTPYASRVNTSSFPQAPTSSSSATSGAATLQTSTSTASATFHDLDNSSSNNVTSDMVGGNAGGSGAGGSGSGSGSVSTGGRRRQHSQMTLAGIQGNNPVSIMQSTEAGVPMWLTKRGLEEIHNVEERLLDRGFNTLSYASIFNDKDMNIK